MRDDDSPAADFVESGMIGGTLGLLVGPCVEELFDGPVAAGRTHVVAGALPPFVLPASEDVDVVPAP